MAAALTDRATDLLTQPDDLARIIAMLLALPIRPRSPNSPSIASLRNFSEMPGPYVVPVHGDAELP